MNIYALVDVKKIRFLLFLETFCSDLKQEFRGEVVPEACEKTGVLREEESCTCLPHLLLNGAKRDALLNGKKLVSSSHGHFISRGTTSRRKREAVSVSKCVRLGSTIKMFQSPLEFVFNQLNFQF